MAYWRHATGNTSSTMDLGGGYEGLALRDDSRTAACLSVDQIEIVDLDTKQPVAKFRNDHHQSQAGWLHRTNDLLAWSDDDRTIDLLSVASKRVLRSRTFDSRILVGGISPADRWALLWNEGVLSRLDLTTFKTSPLPFRIGSLQRLIMSPDGTQAAIWDLDLAGQRMRVIDLTRARVLITSEEQVVDGDNRPCGAAFIPHSSHLLLGRLDGSVRLYDLASGKPLESTRLSAEGPIMDVSVETSGRRAVVVDRHRQSFLLDLGPGTPVVRNRFDDSNQATLLPNGTAIVTLADVLRIRSVVAPNAVTERNIHSLVEGKALASVGYATISEVDGLRTFDLRHLGSPPRHVALPGPATPDETGRFWGVVTPSKVALYDNQGALMGTLPSSLKGLEGLTVDASGKRLFGLRAKSVLAIDLPAGRIVGEWPTDQELADLCLSSDGRKLAVGSQSGDLLAFDAKSGKTLWRKKLGKDRTTALFRFSPDGRWLAIGSYSGIIDVLDAANGEDEGGSFRHGRLSALAWTSASDRLFVGLVDGSVHSLGTLTYPAAFGSTLTGPQWADFGVVARHASPVADIALLPGDRTLASIDRGGTIRLWMTSDRL